MVLCTCHQKTAEEHKLPVVEPSDLEVWRAAQQVIDQHPQEPELTACQNADAAWEAGDMPSMQLWMRIAEAVKNLVETKPHVRTAIN
jgi:hypothetical protein